MHQGVAGAQHQRELAEQQREVGAAHRQPAARQQRGDELQHAHPPAALGRQRALLQVDHPQLTAAQLRARLALVARLDLAALLDALAVEGDVAVKRHQPALPSSGRASAKLVWPSRTLARASSTRR